MRDDGPRLEPDDFLTIIPRISAVFEPTGESDSRSDRRQRSLGAGRPETMDRHGRLGTVDLKRAAGAA